MANSISFVSPQEALRPVRSGDRVYVGSNCGQPQALVDALFARRFDLHGVDIVHLLTAGHAPYAQREHLEHFRHQAFFVGPNVRQAARERVVDYIPVFLSEIPALFRNGQLPLDVALVAVSPPDAHGFCSLGVSVDLGLSACRYARYVVAEVYPDMPRTHGDSFLHVSQIHAFVEAQKPVLEHASDAPDEVSERIGRYIADLIEDGATIQAGIGKIPNAVLRLLTQKNDLGVHTEMFSDGWLEPIRNGNITCRRKTHFRGKIVGSFVLGSRALYDEIHDNPFFEFHPTETVNDPFVVAQNERMVAINSALEVDLTGQVVSDSLGHTIYSGIGGQVDFVRGAARSVGGKPILAMPSTAVRGTVSRITAELQPGAGVVTSRGDVHYVVTEYGVAYLHGKPISERALALIRIAHPDFRDELLERAKEIGLVPRTQPSLAHRYPDELVTKTVLKNGITMTLRPIRPNDEPLLKDHFYALGEESLKRRFGTVLRNLPNATITELCNVDYRQHMGIVGTVPDGNAELIVVVARYYVNLTTNFAEMAMAVRDDWQGHGIGKLALSRLLEIAQAAKLKGIEAWVQAVNAPMLKLILSTGFPTETRREEDQLYVRVTL